MTNEVQIKALEEEIRRLRDEDADFAAKRRESVTPVFRYYLDLDVRNYDKIFDPAVVKFRLSGACTNKAECEAVGHKIDEGGISYLYNIPTESIITQVGGGRIYISNPWGTRRSATDYEGQALAELAAFIAEFGAGGDVTRIVTRHQRAKECDHNGVFAPSEAVTGDVVFCPSCEYDIAIEDL